VNEIQRDAHAVLLPICEAVTVVPWLEAFLDSGGRSVLMSSSPEEYAARRIDDQRRLGETGAQVSAFASAVSTVVGAPVLVAIDAEPAGVQRLEHLLPQLPGRGQLGQLDDRELDEVFSPYAAAARALGIGLFLGPVVDEIRGQNVWLQGRIMGDTLDEITRIGAAYVSSVQRAGLTATAKHFPGHSDLSAHPVAFDITMELGLDEVERNLNPFRRLVSSGVGAVMLGPVQVDALDHQNPAACSPAVVGLLREGLGFDGLIISDDLDATSTIRNRPLGDVAVASLAAGVELLLIPGGGAPVECAHAIAAAVEAGRLSEQALAVAAQRVRALAES
jgi:beta-N-acetylhexosaminidase